MLLTTGILLFTASLGCIQAASTKEGCDVDATDECTAKMIIFLSKETLPVNAAELAVECGVQKAAEACVRAFVEKCVDGVGQVAGLGLIDSIKEEINARCDASSDYQKEFLKHVPCLNSAGSAIHKCLQNLAPDFESASRLEKQQIEGACCKMNVFRECHNSAVHATCDDEGVKFSEGLLQKYTGTLLNKLCRSFSQDNCASLPFSDVKGSSVSKSPLSALLKLSESLS